MSRTHQPLYARMLRLRHLDPSGLLCFVYLEGAVALGFLLALAELVSWWGVLVLPVTVALMVKFNDLVAGSLHRAPERTVAAVGYARAPAAPSGVSGPHTGVPAQSGVQPPARPRRAWAEQLDVREQRVRQSAMRRYE